MKKHEDYHGFNIRTLYYDEPTPKLKLEFRTDAILWNVITLCYYEYTDVLDDMKKVFASTSHFKIRTICNRMKLLGALPPRYLHLEQKTYP